MSAGLSVGIIGAGPGGPALGILLSRTSFRDFTTFDREDDVGGTWRINIPRWRSLSPTLTGGWSAPCGPPSAATTSAPPTGAW